MGRRHWSPEVRALDDTYRLLRTFPRDAQLRMLKWLQSRLEDDARKRAAHPPDTSAPEGSKEGA